MKITESNYVEQLKKHDEKALMYVISEYGGMLNAIVCTRLRLLKDYQEECLNDVFLGIWKNIGSFDMDKSSFRNWCAGIARYKALDFLRRYYREITFENIDDMEIPKVDEELERIAEQEISEELEQMLDCLNETDRAIFLKLYMEEKNLDEVSAETGLKKEVIYNRLSRGKKRIRSIYESREV